MLHVLMRAGGQVVSAEDLLEQAWDEHADPFTNTVRIDRDDVAPQARRPAGDPHRSAASATGIGGMSVRSPARRMLLVCGLLLLAAAFVAPAADVLLALWRRVRPVLVCQA